MFDDAVGQVACCHQPSRHVITGNDRTIVPAGQGDSAARMNDTTVNLRASHR
jgi:hypothetical protein